MKSNSIEFKKRQRVHESDRAGAVVPLFATLLFAMLCVGGLAIDYAYIQQTTIELRTASDAIARSTVTELSLTDSETKARERGLAIAGDYRVGNQKFTLSSNDIEFGRVSTRPSGEVFFQAQAYPPNAARVNARLADNSVAGGLRLFFGPMFGTTRAQLGVSSTATMRIVDVCLVLDRSSSMKLPTESDLPGLAGAVWAQRGPYPPMPDSRWMALDRALREFVQVLKTNRTEERLAVVTFASTFSAFGVTSLESSIDVDITNNLDLILNSVDTLSSTLWNGNTFIESGMRKGIELFETSTNVRTNAERVMIVLTDGYQTDGECRNAAWDCAAKGIRVHSVTVGDFADQQLMSEVATIGNGSYAHASNEAMLREIFRQLATETSTLVQ